jgi:flagellar hook-associated protein 3 FlgL
MRVADKMAFDQVNRSVSKNRSEMSSLQNQAATQKRVTKPSDDPVAASRVLANRVEQRGSDQFIKNLNYAKGFLDFTEQSLAELTETIVRAKELALSQSNDASSNPQSRKIVATEVAQIHDQAVQIANRKLGDRFIFGGFKTTEPPFDQNGNYKGDMGEMKIHIDKESFLAMNVPGAQVFEGKGMSSDGNSFKSTEQARTIEEFKNQKSSGLANTEISDSDQWQEHRVENSEPWQERRTENQGSLQSRGPASLRAPEVSSGSASVSDDANGDVYSKSVKTTAQMSNAELGMARAAQEIKKDGENIFHTLKKMETALLTNDKTAVQESLDRLDSAMQQVVMARTTLGSRVMAINNTLSSMYTTSVDNKGVISQLEDADVFEVISDMNKTEGALQATLQTSGKLIQKSLLDFIS